MKKKKTYRVYLIEEFCEEVEAKDENEAVKKALAMNPEAYWDDQNLVVDITEDLEAQAKDMKDAEQDWKREQK